MYKILLISLGLLCYLHAHAQTDSTAPTQIPILRISSPRISEPEFMRLGTDVLMIKQDGLSKFPTTELSTTLDYLPGVQTQDRGAGAQSDLRIQGSGFEQTMLLLDGVKQIDVQTGHNMMSLPVPLCALSEIRVTKSAMSPRYGVGGLAGGVHLEVHPQAQDGSFLMASYSSFFNKDDSTQRPYAAAELMGRVDFGGERGRHQISWDWLESSGYRYNSDLSRQQISYALEYKISTKTKIDFLTALGSYSFGAAGFYAPPYDQQAHENVTKLISQAHLRTQWEAWQSSTVLYLRADSDRYTLVPSDPGSYQNKHRSTTLGLEQNIHRTNRWGELGLGFEYRDENIHSSNLGQHRRRYLGVFAEQKLELTQNLQITPAGYLGYNLLNGLQLYPGLDANLRLREDRYLFSSLRRGLRNPSFTDLYYSDRANIGNDSLVAEQGWTWCVGYREVGTKHYFSLAPFYRRVHNNITWIDTQPDSAVALWQPFNLATVGTYGFSTVFTISDLALGAQLKTGWSLAYNFTDTDRDIPDSKNSILLLRHQLISGLKFYTTDNRLYTNLTLRYHHRLDDYTYTLIDFRFRYKIANRLAVVFDINNVFDQRYTTFTVEQPGRSFRLGISKN